MVAKKFRIPEYYQCGRCNYCWKSKKRIGPPARCPKCNSRYIGPIIFRR